MDAAQPQRPGGMGWLLACSLLIGGFDLFFLGLAMAFGPTGFGGDRDWSAEETAAANLGQAAGLVGVLLAAVAVIVFLALRSHSRGRAALGAVVGAQLLASLTLVMKAG